MKKRILSLILACTIVLAMSTMSFATVQSGPRILIEDKDFNLEEKSFIDDKGFLMLPLRSLLEKLDYIVKWNDEDKSVNLLRESQNILLQNGSMDLYINGKLERLTKAPLIKDNKTFVTAELLDKSLDSVLGWNSKSESLRIRNIKDEDMFVMSKDQATTNKLDNYMKALVEYENFHGSVLVAKKGEILLNKGYSYADFAQKIKNKSQTRFAIGSVTKQFTALSIMKLKEDGLIDLEDKVSKYIPSAPHGAEISIHNLLTHSSGLKNYTDLPEFFAVDFTNRDPVNMLDLVRGMDLDFKPGEMFMYSNTNYLLAGMIIESITGESFEDYIYSITNPLGLKDTGLVYGNKKGVNDATPYTGYLELMEIDDDLVLSQAYAAGSMYSTVEDLYKWNRLLKSGQLLKKENLEAMFEEHIEIPGAGNYGYGWMIEDTDNGKEVFHGGNTLGSTAYLGNLEEDDITVVILSNNGGYNTNDLKNDLYSIVLDKDYEMPKELKEIEIEDKNLYSNYTGEYEFINGTTLSIIEEDSKLYGQVTGQGPFEIFPETKTKFFAKLLDVNIEFITDETGKATELNFRQAGIEFISKRIGDRVEQVQIEVDPKIYDDYVGEYEMVELGKGLNINISKEGDKLFAKLTGQEKAEIFPSSATEFFYKIVDAQIVFEKDESGKVSSLTLHQMGQKFKAPKIK